MELGNQSNKQSHSDSANDNDNNLFRMNSPQIVADEVDKQDGAVESAVN